MMRIEKRGLKEALLSLLFPPVCLLCGEREESDGLCAGCRRKYAEETFLRCPDCGLDAGRCACGREFLSELPSGPAERRFLALTWYVPKRSGEENGRVTDDMILRFKSRGDYAGFFASELARELERTLGRCGEDPAGWTVSWCPRSPEKFMETGFDQGEELACRVAKKLGCPARSLFTRLSWSAEQKELGAEDRRRNAEEGLVLRRSAVKPGMKVMLLDDIVTTGSTLRAAASLLYGAGAEIVFPTVLARTRRSGGKKT